MGAALDLRGRREDGTELDVDVSLARVQLDGEPFALATVRDVTDRRSIEAALRQSRAQLAEAQRVARMGSWERLVDGDESKWSEQTYRLFGIEPGTRVSFEMFLDHVHPDDRPVIAASVKRALERGTPAECEFRAFRLGERRFMHARAERVDDADGRTRIIGTVTDITEQKRAEVERAAAAALVASSPDAVVEIALDGTIRRWGGASERMFGYTAADAVGQPFERLVPADHRAETAERLQRVRDGGRAERFETVALAKGGAPVDVSASAWPILGADGRPAAIAVIMRDMGELRKLQRRVVLAERSASLGTLASGVAHELNNPLAVVMGSLEFLADELPPVERLLAESCRSADARCKPALLAVREMLDAIRDARECSARMREIVRDMRVFSRADVSGDDPVNVRQVLESTVKIAGPELRQRARLVLDCEDASTRGDESRVGQVLLNLLLNAAQAIPPGRAEQNEIRVVVRQQARWVRIEVSDTGAGIPVAVRGRIFDPFFTLKSVGAGSGLGLAVCQGIVSALGGEISFESEVGKGSTFHVSLPAYEASEGAPRQDDDHATTERRGRVLVVGGEEAIVKLVARLLRKEHEVVGETTARAALARFESGQRFDVVLCDLAAPGMRELYEALRGAEPEAADAMIFLSDAAFDEQAAAFFAGVHNPRLDQPFDVQQLRALVRERVGR